MSYLTQGKFWTHSRLCLLESELHQLYYASAGGCSLKFAGIVIDDG